MAPNHRDNLAQHIHISSADNLSYSVSASSGIKDTIQTIVTGRKCWKTTKGGREVVWPPDLEAALVEGLEKYQPVASRTSRSFGRFPMRNKFISDYILQATDKLRTPKQVGSRLQQLRDTTEGKRILQQLSSRHLAMMQPKSAQNQSHTDAAENRPSTSGSTSSASASSGPAGSSSTPPARVPTSYVYIDVLPDPGTPPLRLPALSSIPSSPLSPTAATSSAIASFVPTPGSPTSPDAGMGLGLNSSGPRVLRHIDPTVTFMSRAALQAYSCFKVMKAGSAPGQAPVHTERTELELLSSSCMPMPQWSSEIQCTFLYRTPFVPRFWDSLCRASDPSAYTVLQEIIRIGAPEADQHAPEDVLLSIVYQFNNVTHTPPLSPDTPTFSSDASRPGTAGSHFSSEGTPELGAELDDMMMFNYPLGPPLSHGMHGSFSSSHHMHSGVDVKTPALIHADEDAYSSLPPTPTSPFDLAGPGGGWPNHHHHHPLAPPAQDCGRGMYGMAGGMGGGMGGDVAIAGTGQFMNSFMGPYGL
ncbi:hypothetical protein LXA43DRAFT_50301 [Ganoderma leucocontextum]|nr:hypothetical protein LXA43DRAFT_50301 [Ganoderma leucocontextum]